MTDSTRMPGRGWAYTGAVLGGLVSVAANVAHSFIPPAGAAPGWSPETGAVIGAIVWPVFLFIAVEILARVAWPDGPWWGLLRYGGMLPVALVAAFVSYKHLSGLLAHYGEEPLVYCLGPLAVDGLMVMATGALLATGARAHRARTLSASPAPADVPTPAGSDTPTPTRAPSAVTPVRPQTVPAPPKPDAPRTPAPPTRSTVANGTIRESAAPPASSAPTVPTAPAPASAPPTTGTPAPSVDAAPPSKPPVPAAMLTRAAHLAEAHHTATNTPITAGELAVRMRVNSDTAARLLATLDHRVTTPDTVNGTPVGAHR